MELITLISIALANGMWEVGKKLLTHASDSALKPLKDRIENSALMKFRAIEKDEKLLGAIKGALKQTASAKDDDELAGWLKNVGLNKLQAEKNQALRQTLARAVIGFTDPDAQPPADLMTALAWPRSRAAELSKLLFACRAVFAGMGEWKDVIAYADTAHQNGLLTGMLETLSKMENAFVQSEAGAYLRVAVVETGLTAEQAARIEEKYRAGIQDEFRKHRVSGLAQVQRAVSLPLEEIYIELGLIQASNEAERKHEAAEMLELSESHRMKRELERIDQRVTNALMEEARLLIKGEPGSGKTIMLKFIALMLTHGNAGAARLGLDAPYLPIFVRLANYAEKLKLNSSLALETFLLDYINSYYPGEKGQPEFLRLALDKGACLILLDGLDEVGDIGDTLMHGNTLRSETIKQVQRFVSRRCNEKCTNRIIVTSRLEGYTAGDLMDFREMEISRLRVPDEVEAFLLRWYTAWLQEADSRLDYEAAQKRAQRDYVNGIMASINQSESVRRLAMNPLLLTILAIIYETGKKLPNRRVELYETVAKTMIENWRQSQTDHVSNIHEMMSAAEVYFTLASLAYWLHENISGGTMSNGEWQEKIHDLLKEAGHEEAELKQLVEHFMRHAKQETGLLTEKSPGQIGFFHLTLEEYMAAVEIARQDTDTRLKMIEKHWQEPQWREVILLTAGDLDQRGNKQFLESFLLYILHLEGDVSGRNVLLAGRALADVGVRRVKESIAKDIRNALKFVMQDADPDTGKPYAIARVPLEARASAADTLDELGYVPDDLYEFVEIRSNDFSRSKDNAKTATEVATTLYFAKHPVTNLQYKRFLDAPDYADEKYWLDFPKYAENSDLLALSNVEGLSETWGAEGFEWLKNNLKDTDDSNGKVVFPRYWNNPRFGITRRTAPVVGINWYEANAYCKWLTVHKDEPEFAPLASLPVSDFVFRLPTENEWLIAAGGLGEPLVVGKNKDRKEINRYRFPWDETGKVTSEPQANDDKIMQDILRRANIAESGINRTTPASMYPLGRTANGLWDMAGNVWEWQANYYNADHDGLALRGGSWYSDRNPARVSGRAISLPHRGWNGCGFRVCLAPPSVVL